MANAIETQGLTRAFGRLEAVRGLDLRVPEGAVFALIGPNGAGKTSTIKMLVNLIKPSRGRAQVLGVDSRRLGPREFQRIAYVSENQRLPEWMTTKQMLEYVRPLYASWDAALADRLQSQLGLRSAGKLRHLSRGMRMKAALLASLPYRPELIVLDEPFSGLDPLVRDELIRALLEGADDRSRTVFVSSHDVDEVERLADWVGFMSEGRLLFAEPVAALLARFRQVEVIVEEGPAPALPPAPGWLGGTAAGRTLRFIDSRYNDADRDTRIAALFPGATIRTLPLALRDIFVALALAARPEAA